MKRSIPFVPLWPQTTTARIRFFQCPSQCTPYRMRSVPCAPNVSRIAPAMKSGRLKRPRLRIRISYPLLTAIVCRTGEPVRSNKDGCPSTYRLPICNRYSIPRPVTAPLRNSTIHILKNFALCRGECYDPIPTYISNTAARFSRVQSICISFAAASSEICR